MNPAKELLDLLKDWDSSTSANLFDVRGDNKDEARQATLRATLLLQQIRDYLETTWPDELEEYEYTLEVAWEHIIAPTRTWQSTSDTSGRDLPKLLRAQLVTISRMMDLDPQAQALVQLPQEHITALVETLQELREDLGAFPKHLSKFTDQLRTKIDRCLYLLDIDNGDGWLLREVRDEVFQTIGQGVHIALLLPEQEQRTSFMQKLFTLAGGWIGNASAGAAGALVAESMQALPVVIQ